MVGRLGPYKSASKMPTLRPSFYSENARLTETVDLPTPPLQLDTATILRTPAKPFMRTDV